MSLLENFRNLRGRVELGRLLKDNTEMSATDNSVHPRFALASVVMLRESRTGAAVLAQLRNISLSGCYVETPRPVAPNGRVQVILQTSDHRAHIWGVVRRRDASGIGIQFTHGATVEDWKRLQSLIQDLQSSTHAAGAAPTLVP